MKYATFDAVRTRDGYIPDGVYGATHEFGITVDGGAVHVVIGTQDPWRLAVLHEWFQSFF
jgi:hypothetical protein